MLIRIAVVVLAIVSAYPAGASQDASGPALVPGHWRAWLDSPGGELPFGLELGTVQDGTWKAWVINGDERDPLPTVTLEADRLTLGFDHYDASIEATITLDGTRLDGTWRKRSSNGQSVLAFHAVSVDAPARFTPWTERQPTEAARWPGIAGRYAMAFSSSETPSVGVLEAVGPNGVHGTILTTTGDYRYLAGRWDWTLAGPVLRLSVFDGAHAFLFTGVQRRDGRISGEFWSRDVWHESWTATPDDDAALPDAFELTRIVEPPDLGAMTFKDLEGNDVTLASVQAPGTPLIIEVFGSWCPNCHDAARFTQRLKKIYGDRVSMVGLAFELTGEHERDATQVRRFAARNELTYPLLVAGLSDKAAASERLPMLDRVRSYPTTIFIDASGAVEAVHQGFTGPATGDAYQELQASFIERIGRMLDREAKRRRDERRSRHSAGG